MNKTENNVAAQTGDEPMQAAFEAIAPAHGITVERWKQLPDQYKFQHTISQFAFFNAAYEAGQAAQVSPRATADVELDAARYRWLRERPYSDWKRIAFNTMDDHPFAIKCRDEEIDVARLATTKPGA